MFTFTPEEWSAVRITLFVASLGLLVSLPVAIAVGWLLARKQFFGKILVEVLVFLPLVLPPVATGYILIVLFGRQGLLGKWITSTFGFDIIFTWRGMVLAAAVMGFPLIVRVVRASFEAIDPQLARAARTLGCTRLSAFFRVSLPLAWPGLLAGALLGFARALGEFGATRMVSLNAEGTRTLALEIFQLAETPGAPAGPLLRLLLLSVLLSAAALWVCEVLARRWRLSGS